MLSKLAQCWCWFTATAEREARARHGRAYILRYPSLLVRARGPQSACTLRATPEGALGPRSNTGQTTPGQNTARAVMLTGLPACHLLSMWLIYYYGCVTWLGHHAVSRDIASNKQVCYSYIGPWLNQCGWPALLMRHLGVPRVASFLDELPGLARAVLAVVAPWAMANRALVKQA